MSKLSNPGVIAALAALAGCAAAPRAEIDSAKLHTIHTVTVVYPGKAVYIGGRAQMPLLLTGGGLIGAALTGAVTGLANASSAKQKPLAFDDVVTAKLGKICKSPDVDWRVNYPGMRKVG